MGQIINFPTKKGNAAIHIEGELKYEEDPEKIVFSLQLQRIKASLTRINELMQKLKETTNDRIKE